MNEKMSCTPFVTHLSGSDRETENRLKNIFSGPKKRSLALLLALMFSVCIFCGSLVSCQNAEAPDTSQSEQNYAEPWSDDLVTGKYIILDENGQEAQETMENIPGVLLSEEELAQFNEIFAAHLDAEYCLPVNGFFTSLYDDVTDTDF